MSTKKTRVQLHPDASKEKKSKKSKATDNLINKYGWLVVVVFAVSTALTLTFLYGDLTRRILSGQAADNITAYNQWKVNYGLNNSNDAYGDVNGDGVTNIAAFNLNVDPRSVLDGSVLQVANTSSSSSSSIASSSSSVSTSSSSSSSATSSSVISSSSSSSAAISSSSSIADGDSLVFEIPGSQFNNGSNSPQDNTPGFGSSGSSNISDSSSTAGNRQSSANSSSVNSGQIGVSSGSGTLGTSNALSGNRAQNNNILATSSTVRTGGEINYLTISLGLVSLVSGIYLLFQYFKKSQLKAHEGEI